MEARRRLYPAKPKVGIRAKRPAEWLHIDTTVIKLLDGTKTYLHAVVDNYTRRVLAWVLKPKLTAETTRNILREAARLIPDSKRDVIVMSDGGSENLVFNELADLSQVVAQIDVAQSNSMIEALWHQVRHRWLYLHTLDTFAGLEQLVAKYIEDHNSLIPRAELGGRTPDEAFFGLEIDLPERLRVGHEAARIERLAKNRERRCSSCRTTEVRAAA